MDKWEGRCQLNRASEILFHELTALVHGEEEAKKAENAAKALLRRDGDSATAPRPLCAATLTLKNGGINILPLLVATNRQPSCERPAASFSRAALLWMIRRSAASTRASRKRSSPARALSSARAKRCSTRLYIRRTLNRRKPKLFNLQYEEPPQGEPAEVFCVPRRLGLAF